MGKYTENDLQNLVALCSMDDDPPKTLLPRCEKALAYRDTGLRLTARDREFLQRMYAEDIDASAKATLDKILKAGCGKKDTGKKQGVLRIRTECMGCISRKSDTPETVVCRKGNIPTCLHKKKECVDCQLPRPNSLWADWTGLVEAEAFGLPLK